MLHFVCELRGTFPVASKVPRFARDDSVVVVTEVRSYPFAGCTFIQCRAISSRVATQTLGFEAT